MAIIKRANFDVHTLDKINNLLDYFNSLNAPLLDAEIENTNDIKLTINNDVIIRIGHFGGSFVNNGNTVTINGTTSANVMVIYYTLEVTVAYDNNIFFLMLYDDSGRRGEFLYEKLDQKNIFGYWASGGDMSQPFKSIGNFSFVDTSGGINNYKHAKLLNYSTQVGTLDYIVDTLLTGTTKDMIDNNFISCTDVVAGSVISFNGKNYYALGTNTLLEITL